MIVYALLCEKRLGSQVRGRIFEIILARGYGMWLHMNDSFESFLPSTFRRARFDLLVLATARVSRVLISTISSSFELFASTQRTSKSSDSSFISSCASILYEFPVTVNAVRFRDGGGTEHPTSC